MAPKECEKEYDIHGELEDLNPIDPEPEQPPKYDPPPPSPEPPTHTPAWRRLEDFLPPRLPAFGVLVLVLLVVFFISYRGGLIECDSLGDTAVVGTGILTFLTIVMISCVIT